MKFLTSENLTIEANSKMKELMTSISLYIWIGILYFYFRNHDKLTLAFKCSATQHQLLPTLLGSLYCPRQILNPHKTNTSRLEYLVQDLLGGIAIGELNCGLPLQMHWNCQVCTPKVHKRMDKSQAEIKLVRECELRDVLIRLCVHKGNHFCARLQSFQVEILRE